MEGAIPKRSSGEAATTPKAEPSLLSSLPPPPASAAPTQQKKAQPSQSSQQQRPQQGRSTETINLPQVSSVNNYQPRPKSLTLTEREKHMVKNLDELAEIVSSNVYDAIESSNALLSVDPREFKQREKQGGSIEMFGSFVTNSENQYDFFDTDAITNTINVTPLPNNRIPIFPEDFPPNAGKTEWPLKWWGIHQPAESLLQLHEEKALSLGYPVSHRKIIGSPSGRTQSSIVEKPCGKESKDSKSSSKTDSDKRRRKRSGDSGKERSRKRHSDDRRHRRN